MKIFRAEPSNFSHIYNERLGFPDSLFFKTAQQRQGFYRRMFDEDFARLFRSHNRRTGNLFEVVSSDEGVMHKLLENIRTRYAPRSVDETVRELIENVAQTLIWSGKAYYFLYGDLDDETVHVVSFNSDGVFCLLGTYIQWVPKHVESRWNEDDIEHPREIRILDSTKVLRFSMPSAIQRILRQQNKTLAVLDKLQFITPADFRLQATYENPNPTSHFDYKVWSDLQSRALYRATRGTGWNGRKYDSSKGSDFFDCHRLIRFRRNQILLRDEILKQLSTELSRVGKSLASGFSVKIFGTDQLPSLAALDELALGLAAESVGFKEIIDYCYKR
jgi:hypothetical protein